MARFNVSVGEPPKRTTVLIADDLATDLRRLASDRGVPPGALLAPVLSGVARGAMSARAEAWVREQVAAARPPAAADEKWPPARRIAEAINAARGLPAGPSPAQWLEAMVARLPEPKQRQIAALRADPAAHALAGAAVQRWVARYLAAPLRADRQMAEELALDVNTFRAAAQHDPQMMMFAVRAPGLPRRWPAFIVHPYWQGLDLWRYSQVWGVPAMVPSIAEVGRSS